MGALTTDAPQPANDFYAGGFDLLPSGSGIDASFANSWYYNPLQELSRGMQQTDATLGAPVDTPSRYGVRAAPTSPLLSPEEANKQYGIQGTLTFDKPTRQREAELLNQWAQLRRQREDQLRRATPGFFPAAARFGAGFLAGALDPINIASAFIPVVGEERWAATLARAGIESTTVARLSRGAIEGAVGQAVVEPITYLQSQREQADYTMADSLLNIAFGTVLGGGLHAGFGKVGDLLAPPASREALLRGSVAALADGRPVRVAEALRLPSSTLAGQSFPSFGSAALFAQAAANRYGAPVRVSEAGGEFRIAALTPSEVAKQASAPSSIPKTGPVADAAARGEKQAYTREEIQALVQERARLAETPQATPADRLRRQQIEAELQAVARRGGIVTSEQGQTFISNLAQGESVPAAERTAAVYSAPEGATPASELSPTATPKAAPTPAADIAKANAQWKPDPEDVAPNPVLDAKVAEASQPIGDKVAETESDIKSVEEALAEVDTMLRDATASGLLDEQALKALKEGSATLDKEARDYEKAAKAAAVCMSGRA